MTEPMSDITSKNCTATSTVLDLNKLNSSAVKLGDTRIDDVNLGAIIKFPVQTDDKNDVLTSLNNSTPQPSDAAIEK